MEVGKNICFRWGYWLRFCPCHFLDVKLGEMLNFLICEMRMNFLEDLGRFHETCVKCAQYNAARKFIESWI